MKVLAFETSCDETSAAVVSENFRVLSNITRTQLEHSEFGGVVPEIASRAHVRLIGPITIEALKRANLEFKDIDAVAATYGPGLIGALLVGLVFAKTLAQTLEIPFIAVNHLEGHIFSIFFRYPDLTPPFLVLIASGGHTELYIFEDFFRYKFLGATRDDASGEAFDKGAKLLGLPYPGGPLIDKLAKQGNPEFHKFPIAKVPGYDFSFSGLKTALLYYLRGKSREFLKTHINDIAASYQEAIVDALLSKIVKAVSETGIKRVAIVGGVSLNSRLREKAQKLEKIEFFFPFPEHCADNAAMIGAVAVKKLERGMVSSIEIGAIPDLAL